MADERDDTEKAGGTDAKRSRRTRSSASRAGPERERGEVAADPYQAASHAVPTVEGAALPGAAALERQRVGRYRIGAVAAATGIPAHTLRVWERRYGAFSTSRTGGGTRLYSEADVERARALAQLQQRGHAIGQIAGLPDPELAALMAEGGIVVPPAPVGPGAAAVLPAPTADLRLVGESFLEAVRAFELVRAERILRSVIAGAEPRELVMELMPPLFEEIGRRWETGAFEIAHEHAASALLRDSLGTLLQSWRPATQAKTVVSTTLSGELHEFGALLAALLASVHGWRSVYLGPNLPSEEILLAASRVDAGAVLVSVVCAQGARACRDFAAQVMQVREGLSRGCALIVGGAAAPLLKLSQPGVTVMADLPALERWLTRPGR